MSIIRIGLAETKHFKEGYAAIFGSKKKDAEPATKETQAKTPAKKPARAAKKKGKK